MAREVASLVARFGADISGLQRGIGRATSELQKFSTRTAKDLNTMRRAFLRVGAAGAAVFTPAIMNAAAFDRAVTNSAAVLGIARDQQAALSDELSRFARNTVAGPQRVAEAYFDIVSGVADASAHMAILENANRLAEAGQADLSTTTAGLVAIMNAYGLGTDDAAGVTDVFANTFRTGVGTMDQFVAAMSPIAATTAAAGVSVEELGGAMAALTAGGAGPAQAATRLNAAVAAFLKPNEQMNEALRELGFQSGAAFLETFGLQQSLQMLSDVSGGVEGNLAAVLGSTEALSAAVVLGTDEANASMHAFTGSLEGATDAARDAQIESFAHQWGILRSQISALSIEIGKALLPVLTKVVKALIPIVERITEWVMDNRDLIATAAKLTLGIGALGVAMTAISGVILVTAGVLSLLANPLIAGVVLAIALRKAWDQNFMGIQDRVWAFHLRFQVAMVNIRHSVERLIESFSNLSFSLPKFDLPSLPSFSLPSLPNMPSFQMPEINIDPAAFQGARDAITGVHSAIAGLGVALIVFRPVIENAIESVVGVLSGLGTLQVASSLLSISRSTGLLGLVAGRVFPLIVSLFNPVTAALAAGAAVGFLLKRAWDTNFLGIRDRVREVFDFVKEKIEGVINWLNDQVDLSGVVAKFEGPFNAVKTFFDNFDLGASVSSVVNSVANVDVNTVIQTIVREFARLPFRIFALLIRAAGFVATGVIQWGPSILAKLFETVGEISFWAFQNIIQPLFMALWNAPSTIANAVINWGPRIFSKILETLGAIGEWVSTNIIAPFTEGIDLGVGDVTAALSDFGTQFFGAIIDSLGDIGAWVLENIINPIVDTLAGLGSMIVDAINNAIPNDVGLHIPSVSVPVLGEIFGGADIRIDLPDNPVPGGSFARGTPFTGNGAGGFMAQLHPREAVVPAGGMVVHPSRRGLMLDGGGGMVVNIENLQARDLNDLLRQLQNIAKSEGF